LRGYPAWIRTKNNASKGHFVILTAKADEADRISGLEMGADDYVTQPFNPREMVLRIKVIDRRRAAEISDVSDEKLACGLITVDTSRHRVDVAGK
jgi:DNA-binding response OmpR family regulator